MGTTKRARRRRWLMILGGAFAGLCALAAACGGDDDGTTIAGSDGGVGGDASTTDGGASGDGAPTDGGADARVKNVGTWRRDPQMGLDYDWVAGYSATPNDVHIAGNSPVNLGPGAGILRRSVVDGGLAWRSVFGNSGYTFHDLSGVGADDIWAVGFPSAGFDGGAWGPRSPSPAGNADYPLEIWGAGPNDYWAITGTIPTELQHFGGSTWEYVDAGVESILHVGGGSGAAGHVYGLGYRHTGDGGVEYVLVHGTGGVYSVTSLGSEVPSAVWASSPNDVFVVGAGGLVLHYDGTTWTKQASGTAANLHAVWGTAWFDVFAVGDDVVLHFDGDVWEQEPLPDAGGSALRDVFGTGPADVWAVGSHGVVLHRTP